mgnify:CR=1 FL=1
MNSLTTSRFALPLLAEADAYAEPARTYIRAGIERVADYQNLAYARDYLDRLKPIAEADKQYGSGSGLLLSETARELALGMAYEDTVRVAELKIRPNRFARVRAEAEGLIATAINQADKQTRVQAVEKVKEEVKEKLKAELPEDQHKFIGGVLGDLEYTALRSQVLDTGFRVDGRTPHQVRQISVDTAVLPRAHGSALFTRGQTQALVSTTLGTANDVQRLDSIDEPKESTKSFMLHYNFPPFSVGETGRTGSPGRREIGHGALAERSIAPVIPSEEEFPYAIRVSSEIMESNGSTSMASICGMCWPPNRDGNEIRV